MKIEVDPQYYISESITISIGCKISRFYSIRLLILEKDKPDYPYLDESEILDRFRTYIPFNFARIAFDIKPRTHVAFLEIKRRLKDTWNLDVQNFSPSFDRRTPSPLSIEDEPVHHIIGMTQPNIAHLSFLDFLGSLLGISYDLRFTDEIHILDDI